MKPFGFHFSNLRVRFPVIFFFGGGRVSHKKWNNQESVRSDVDECIKCTANNYATLSSCKSYLGE